MLLLVVVLVIILVVVVVVMVMTAGGMLGEGLAHDCFRFVSLLKAQTKGDFLGVHRIRHNKLVCAQHNMLAIARRYMLVLVRHNKLVNSRSAVEVS